METELDKMLKNIDEETLVDLAELEAEKRKNSKSFLLTLPGDVHYAFKCKCAELMTTMKDRITKLIKEDLKKPLPTVD